MAKDKSSRTKRVNVVKSKPYERPTSILKKVTSTVCDLLPSWLNLPSWTSIVGGSADVNQVHEDSDNEVDLNDTDNVELLDPCNVAEPIVLAASSAGSSDISHYTRGPLVRTAPDTLQPSANGDDQSDNSESSASTSGCSSLAPSHQEKKRLLRGLPVTEEALSRIKNDLSGNPSFLGKRKKDASVFADLPEISNQRGNETPSSRGSLWSEDEGLLLPKRATKPQPFSVGNKPTFRLASFGAPIPMPINGKPNFASSLLNSPFYQGRTIFGGASAANTSRFLSTRTDAPRVAVRKQSSPECISSTARRILNTLESMTTPLSDVKKIPTEKHSVDFALSFTPTSYKRHSTRSVACANKTPRLGPPVRSIGTPYPTHVARFSTTSNQIPASTAPVLSQAKNDDIADTRKVGGKIRRQNKRSHYSAKANTEEVEEVTALPDVYLPPITSMPRFSFSNMVTSTPVTSSTSVTPQRTVEQPVFSFAFPIQHNEPVTTVCATSVSQSQQFTFSAPVIVTSSQEMSLGKSNNGFSSGVTLVAKPKSTQLKETESTEDDNQNYGGLKPAAELIIGGSVMDILGGKSKEDVSGDGDNVKTQKTDVETSKASLSANYGFGNQFKPQPGSWICSCCFVSNVSSSTACVACTVPREGEVAAPSVSFNAKSDTLSVNKKSEASEPVSQVKSTFVTASESSTSATNTAVHGFGNKFAPPSGSWECDACMVPNRKDVTQCIACQTPKSTAEKTTGVKETFTGFKFGNLSKSSSSASSPASFKFGMTEISDKDVTVKAPSSTSIAPIFGTSQVAAAESAKPVAAVFGDKVVGNATFKFGLPPKEPEKASSDLASKSKIDTKDVVSSGGTGFKFAAPAAESVEKPSTGFVFGVPSTKSSPPDTDKKTEKDSVPSATTANTGFKFLASSDSTAVPFGGQGMTFGSPMSKPRTVTTFVSATTEAPAVPATGFSLVTKRDEPTPVTTLASGSLFSKSKTVSAAADSTGFKFGLTNVPKTVEGFKFGESTPKTTTVELANEKKSSAPKVPDSNIFGQITKPLVMKFGEDSNKPTGIAAIQLPTTQKSAASTPVIPFAGFQTSSTACTSNTTTISTATSTAPTGAVFNFFAATKAEAKATTSTPMFAFGQGKPVSSSGVSKTVGFTFGDKTSSVVAPVAATTTTNSGSTSSMFVFAPSGFSTTENQKPSKMPDVGDAKVAAVTPCFTFGSATPKFEFGPPKTEASTGGGGFKFSLTPASSATGGSTPAFGGFGATPVSSASGFSFGTAASTPTTSVFGAAPTAGSVFGVQGTFGGFGSCNTTPAFGQSQDISLETPAFGSTAPVSGFQFNPSGASENPLFRFGAQQQDSAPSKTSFAFGNAPAQPTSSNTGFNFSAPTGVPSFNFGAPPQSSSPFQFNPASSDNIFSSSASSSQVKGRKIRRGIRRTKLS